MKSIRIKIKHVLLIVSLLIVVVFFSNNIYWTGVKIYNQVTGVDLNTLDSYSMEGENKRLDLILNEHEYKLFNLITMGSNSSIGTSRIRQYDADKVLETFNMYNKNNKVVLEYPAYAINVILIQWFSGNTEETIELLNQLDIKYLSDTQKDNYYLIKTAVDLTYFNLEEVKSSIEMLSKKYDDLSNQIQMFVNRVYGFSIEYEEVDLLKGDRYYDYYGDIIAYNQQYNENFTYEVSSKLEILDTNIVKGKVTINGKPVKNALIYFSYHNGMSTYEGIDENTIRLDEDGNYEVVNNYDGLRSVNLIIPWHLIHDKQFKRYWNYDFTKDEVIVNYEFTEGLKFNYAYIEKGHFYYEILDNGSNEDGYILQINHFDPDNTYSISYYNITDQSGVIPLEDIHRYTDFSFGRISSGDALNIKRFTEHLYLTGKYYFSVKANLTDRSYYVSNGLDSDALLAVVEYVGYDDYNEGDDLIADGKISEAIQWYENNPSRHNLKVLLALHQWGMTPIDYGFNQRLEGRDLNKAVGYLEALIELDGETNKRKLLLAELYKSLHDYDEELVVLDQIISENSSVYEWINYGYNHINRGFYYEGINILLEHGDMSVDGDRYLKYFILGNEIEYLSDNIKTVFLKIEGISNFNPFFEMIRSGQYEIAYKWLNSKEESDIKSMYLLMFFESFSIKGMAYPYDKVDDRFISLSNYVNYYRETVENIEDDDIKNFLKEIKKNNGWY